MKKIICVVDNSVKRSTHFWGEHGVSFWIESGNRIVLFDSGSSGTVLVHNLDQMGLQPEKIQALILSHAHYDHTGGLEAILQLNPDLPLYANSDLFRPRFSKKKEEYEYIGISLNFQQLNHLTRLYLDDEPIEAIPGLWTTGEIIQRPEQEGRSSHHFVPSGDGWQPDPYRDDMSVVLQTSDGLILICGCCHAGLLNTMGHVRNLFRQPITAVVGGTHLESADNEYLKHVINVLTEEYFPTRFYLNHCTGERALIALANSFGNLVRPFPVGSELIFDGE